MWRERPSRTLLKTSGFRLALRSLALSLGGAMLVFVIIHRDADTIWREQNDIAVIGFSAQPFRLEHYRGFTNQ